MSFIVFYAGMFITITNLLSWAIAAQFLNKMDWPALLGVAGGLWMMGVFA